MKVYIYENEFWPNFTWNDQEIIEILGKVRNLQGRIVGKMESLGFNLKQQAELETLKTEILRSSEIEGEILNPEQVRSSIARKLGMDISGLIPSDRNVEGIVDMMLDATQNFSQPLTKERLFDWHYALFPTGRSGMYKVIVGNWRNDSTGPMQVISGPMGKEKVHFQAPAATRIEEEMNTFLDWFNNYEKIDLVLKAGIAHLWFVTIHPFEDGNGRIARTISDMLLARADGISQRFYSMSAQIRQERKEYYEILGKTQKGDLNITKWLTWFLSCLLNALNESNIILEKVISKHNFWIENALKIQNERQKLMLNKILDGDFFGKLTSSKWAKITKCSPDTALRDIQDLIDKGILKKAEKGGRSTNYELIE
jgi:Fic family protein